LPSPIRWGDFLRSPALRDQQIPGTLFVLSPASTRRPTPKIVFYVSFSLPPKESGPPGLPPAFGRIERRWSLYPELPLSFRFVQPAPPHPSFPDVDLASSPPLTATQRGFSGPFFRTLECQPRAFGTGRLLFSTFPESKSSVSNFPIFLSFWCLFSVLISVCTPPDACLATWK